MHLILVLQGRIGDRWCRDDFGVDQEHALECACVIVCGVACVRVCTFQSVPADSAGHDVVALSDLLKDTEHPTCASSIPSQLNYLQTNHRSTHCKRHTIQAQ